MTQRTTSLYSAGDAQFAADFSLSITQALKIQLTHALDHLPPAKLTRANLDLLDDRGGIYQLMLDGNSVYIGKSKGSLPKRLTKHFSKISGRTAGLLDRITFRCLYVNEDLDSMAPEKMLIQTLKSKDQAPWNQNGFGNNDPGRKRDNSMVKEEHFDRMFGINIDLNISPKSKKPIETLYQTMTGIKLALPYTFRFPSKSPEAKDLRLIDVSSERPDALTMTVGEWMNWLAQRLPAGWMITSFPGYIICYQEADPETYESRTGVWLSEGGGFQHFVHVPQFDDDGLVEDEDNVPEDED
ncbi:GIY-YIG nuclease family protein [Arthrobacter sp. zg-Y1143]|uniref:GIY-YIG nuclease family protein n=1 Tax=Arthrobacter sp. zg-Y1143 TaxID=3049065 RepID=UPI0024C3BF72|nr:GIY-YIG nuclease family protein [Arthrobacter sp. zg-Y1143]MDK1328261.1 GIY-YIG nuclease family protein [Arthrobacter sp. zg-Y1143]